LSIMEARNNHSFVRKTIVQPNKWGWRIGRYMIGVKPWGMAKTFFRIGPVFFGR
jgi:hypothetical protein